MATVRSVSELFDADAWDPVPGFDLEDITYHRAKAHGTVRVAFDRPEVRNAFRPDTVDELYRVLDHARQTTDVGCVLLTGNGPSPRGRRVGVLLRRRPAHPRQGRLPVRRGRHRRHHRPRQDRPPPHPRGAAAHPLHAQGGDLRRPRLGGRRRAQPPRGVRPHPRLRGARPLQADRRRRRQLRRRLRLRLPRPPGRPEVRPRDLLPRRRVLRRRRAPHGHGERGRPARRPRARRPRVGRQGQRQEPHRPAHAQVRLQPHRRRPGGPAALRRRGHPPRLHDRRGPGGPRRLPREARPRLVSATRTTTDRLVFGSLGRMRRARARSGRGRPCGGAPTAA